MDGNAFGRMGTDLERIWRDENAFGMHLDGLGTHLERRSEKGQQFFDVGRSHEYQSNATCDGHPP